MYLVIFPSNLKLLRELGHRAANDASLSRHCKLPKSRRTSGKVHADGDQGYHEVPLAGGLGYLVDGVLDKAADVASEIETHFRLVVEGW